MKAKQDLEKIFQEYPSLNLWIVEYGITHEYLKFSLFLDCFPQRVEVTCTGCSYYQGELKGGPYQLKVGTEIKNNEEKLLINSEGNKLIIKCESISKISMINGGFKDPGSSSGEVP